LRLFWICSARRPSTSTESPVGVNERIFCAGQAGLRVRLSERWKVHSRANFESGENATKKIWQDVGAIVHSRAHLGRRKRKSQRNGGSAMRSTRPSIVTRRVLPVSAALALPALSHCRR